MMAGGQSASRVSGMQWRMIAKPDDAIAQGPCMHVRQFRFELAALAALALASCATPARERAVFIAPPAEAPTALACAPAAGLSDSDNDLARVDPALLTNLCGDVVQVNDVGRAWTIERFQSGRPGPLWIVPHDDENSAFASAVAALNRHGGILVAVDNHGLRTNDAID